MPLLIWTIKSIKMKENITHCDTFASWNNFRLFVMRHLFLIIACAMCMVSACACDRMLRFPSVFNISVGTLKLTFFSFCLLVDRRNGKIANSQSVISEVPKKSSMQPLNNGIVNGNQIIVEVETNMPVCKTNGLLPNS